MHVVRMLTTYDSNVNDLPDGIGHIISDIDYDIYTGMDITCLYTSS